MNKKILFSLGLVAVLGFGLVGCGEETPADCKAGESKCADGKIMSCVDGAWDAGKECKACNADGKTCDDNAEGSKDCSANETKCADGKIMSCVDGAWDAGKECKACNADGKTCDDKAEDSKECAADETKCADGKIFACVDDKWDAGKECKACNADGKTCDDKEVAVIKTEVDAECTSEEVGACSADKSEAFYCASGKVAKISCAGFGESYECHVIDGEAGCNIPCAEAELNNPTMACIVDSYDTSVNKTIPVRCIADDNGGFAYADDPTPTSNGQTCEKGESCVNGECLNCTLATPVSSSCEDSILVRVYDGDKAACNDAAIARFDCKANGGCVDEGDGLANCQDFL